MTARRRTGALPAVLLVEPDGLVRGTLASVSREMRLAQVHSVSRAADGEQWLMTHRPVAVLLSLTEGDAALDLLVRLREGAYACNPQTPVVAMARDVKEATVLSLKDLDVRRLLLQPFRLRDVIHTLENACRLPIPAARAHALA